MRMRPIILMALFRGQLGETTTIYFLIMLTSWRCRCEWLSPILPAGRVTEKLIPNVCIYSPFFCSMIKSRFPGSVVSADVALDCYSDHGHDGVVKDGKILNDETVVQLTKQAICQARAGADVVAPR